VLDSRIQNLPLLTEKRTDAGIAQGQLAVDVARAFIRQEVATRDERAGLKLLERVECFGECGCSVSLRKRPDAEVTRAVGSRKFSGAASLLAAVGPIESVSP
jgi:hypothetical protein